MKNCDKAIEVSGTDKEIIIDAYNLKGICLFRLGSLIEAVKALYKGRKIRAKLDQEIEERRLARLKVDVDELVGFFTKKDLALINKKRSNSFYFSRHKKVRKQKKSQMKRDISWTAYEFYDHMQK